MNDIVKILVSMPRADKEMLMQFAKSKHLTMSMLVRLAVKDYMRKDDGSDRERV